MVLFVLLLVGLREYSRLRADLVEVRAELQTQAGDLEEARIDLELRSQELEAAEEALHLAADWPEDFERLVHESLVERANAAVVRSAAKVRLEKEELTTRLVAVEAEARAREDEAERLRTALAAKIGSEATDLVTEALQEAQRARERVARLEEAASEARGESERLDRLLRERTSQLEYVQERNRAAGRGMDHPPCWVSPAGRIEYLLSITVGEEFLSTRPAWPAHRESEALSLPGIGALLDGALSPEAFAERSGPILAWSKSQEPECRHFVRVDESADTVDGFKDGLLAIESAFYKYLER